MIKSVPLNQALAQSIRLDRALRLVWKSAPGWTVANAVLVLAQGLLPLAGISATVAIILFISTRLLARYGKVD